MPYKIVETVEKGKCKLFLVPNNWEQNNILHWPKWKVETLLAAEDSYPDASWHNMKCQVKRTGLLLIANAEAELVKMCQKSDTESEEFEYQIPFKSQVAIAQEDKRNMNSIQELFTCTSDNTPQLQSTTIHIPDPSQTNEASVYVEDASGQLQGNSMYNYVDQSDKIDKLIAITETLSQNQGVLFY